MSINITVNGKYKAFNKPPSILDDPVRVKKQKESELRKQRLLEVREQSKNIARKIRNDVAAEKELQLKNLEAMKEQEWECWRQHVLQQKNKDYRQAIFQVGAAHRAAKLENEEMAKRQKSQQQQRELFLKKTKERLGAKPAAKAPMLNKKTLQSAATQTIQNSQLENHKKTKQKTPKKRKRKYCTKNHISTCHCSSADGSEDSSDVECEKDTRPQTYEQTRQAASASNKKRGTTTKSIAICPCPKVIECPCACDSSTTSVSTLSSTCTEVASEEQTKTSASSKKASLCKNPPVIIDIDVNSNDEISITQAQAGEIKDRYAESNRQFSHVVVRDSGAEKHRRAMLKEQATTINDTNSTASVNQVTKKVHKPRFTQISQLLSSKSVTSVSRPTSPTPPSRPSPPPPSLAVTSTSDSKTKSPQKSDTTANATTVPQISASRGTVTLISDAGKRVKDQETMRPSHVQSYDYNNKYHRSYPQPMTGLVHEPSVRERNELNAIQQARMERELEVERELEKERRRERSEERGRRALEREQARRECLQLTEKLDALTEQYPQLLKPPNINSHTHQLHAERTENKRNAAVEELLTRPAIIICPEIVEQQTRHTKQQTCPTGASGAANHDDLNLAAPRINDQINLTGSTDSCGSILLGYVDDQQQKIRNDLNKCAGAASVASAGDQQPKPNAQKVERLIKLLERIEELRKALGEELSKSGNSVSMEQVINGVSDLRRERERILRNEAKTGEGREGGTTAEAKQLNEVARKEALLEQKLRELCKMQKVERGQTKENDKIGKGENVTIKNTADKECRVQTTGNKPLEIIIKLKNDVRGSKTKAKKPTKSPRKLATLIDTPPRRMGIKRAAGNLREKAQQQQKQAAQGGMGRQNSYDSNSTSYRSLPSRLVNEVDAIVECFEMSDDAAQEEEQEEEKEQDKARDGKAAKEQNIRKDNYKEKPTSTGANTHTDVRYQAQPIQRPPRLNPLVAHYVQRLLGMSRNSVRALGMSSSDIETPSSSVMNVSTNRSLVALTDSQERIERVQKFIEDNRSFINELEESLRTQSDVTLETSVRMFEEIWQQRLRQEKQTKSRGERQIKDKGEVSERPRQMEQRQRQGGLEKRDDDGKKQKRLSEEHALREKQQGVVGKENKRVTEERRKTAGPRAMPAPRTQQQQQRKVMEQRAQLASTQDVQKHQQQQQRATQQRAQAAATQAIKQQQQRKAMEQRAAQPGVTEAVKQQPHQQQKLTLTQTQQQRRQEEEDKRTTPRPQRQAEQHMPKEQPQPQPQHKRDISVATEQPHTEEHIARYQQLTENCTQRIAELTELIQKVRTEKKRLMEITLSSVSEERNSTEYIELPDGTRRRSNASTDKNTSLTSITTTTSSGSGSGSGCGSSGRFAPKTQSTESQQPATTSAEQLSALESAANAPLEKHKLTGISRDSGISISRPLTSQELEPPSQASTTTATTTHPSTSGAAPTRKSRPPPTMQRYSPNFAEDDVAHELSTIIEVDTPGTSRINATATAAAGGKQESRLQPQPFPTFEEYAREMHLDVSQLDENTSMRAHQEFDKLIANLRNAPDGAVPDYREFPSLSAYLRNLSGRQDEDANSNSNASAAATKCQTPENIDELISCLRIANLSIKAFPTRREYLRELAEPHSSASDNFLDSGSLENIADSHIKSNTETDSISIDIEEELRRRNILQTSFRVAKAKKEEIFSSTAREGAEQARASMRAFAESGIEKITTTTATTEKDAGDGDGAGAADEDDLSEFERELFDLGIKWPATMRARTKQAEAVGRSNTSTSSSTERAAATQKQRHSPRKFAKDAKSGESSPRKVVQFERRTSIHSSGASPKRTTQRAQSTSRSPRREVSADGDVSGKRQQRDTQTIAAKAEAATTNAEGGGGAAAAAADRLSRSSQQQRHNSTSHRSTDCEFVSSEFGRPLNLREFLTKELLKYAISTSSSSSITPNNTDDSLRGAFLQSIIETMTPRSNSNNNNNIGGGSNQLDRQKTSTPVTSGAPSQSSGGHGGGGGRGERGNSSGGETIFSAESGLSSVRFYERSITRSYPSAAPQAPQAANAAAASERSESEIMTEIDGQQEEAT